MPNIHPAVFAVLCALCGLSSLVAASPLARGWFAFAAACWGVAYFVAAKRRAS